MIKFDLKDETLFGNEAGEDEDLARLNSYFIPLPSFSPFFDRERSLSIVSARKGMGKSALLSQLRYRLENDLEYQKPIVVRAKGNELLGLGNFSNKDQAYLENYWKQIICKKLVIELGNRIGFALTSDEMSLVEIAELEGIKSKNIVGGLVARIKWKIRGVSVDTKSSIPNNHESLLNNFLEKNGERVVWILIDDIDAKYQNSEEYQARVGSFFSAIRSLAFEHKGLRIRATVRSDVWSSLRHLEDLDKLDQYLIEIFWSKRHMHEIFVKKILSYVTRNHPDSQETKYTVGRDYNKIIDLLFVNQISWSGNHDSKIFEAISTFSNRRPRWMVQLCRMAAVKTDEMRNKKIDLDHIKLVLEEFGKKRRDDLMKEHKHQFQELEALIDAFRATEKEFRYSEIEKLLAERFIRGRSAAEIPLVDGAKYFGAEDLGNFVYKLGLISRKHPDGIKFTHYTDDPDLYRSEENRRGNIVWSIHPTYRTFLNIH